MSANAQIADRLIAAREGAGFRSAAEAAEALGVTYSTYASHENGTRGFGPAAAAKYARRYRVSLDWLLGGRGDGPSATPSAEDDMLTKFRQLELSSPEEAENVRRSVNRLLDGALRDALGAQK